MLLNLIIFVMLIDKSLESIETSAVIPKFVHGVNEVWDHVKDGVNDVMDCIAIKHSPAVEDVKFYLYTPKYKDTPEEMNYLNNISNSLNPKFVTKVLIHGYTQSHKNEFLLKMKDVYVATEALNVIMVNWENLASPSCYPIAADYTGFVGQLTGYLISRLPHEKVHIIGFSLGAHVGGIAGQMQNPKVIRITGLDPAGPMFINNPDSKRLDSSDAQNVDIIHTSIAGISVSLGHADFYVNGGKVQLNCSTADVACSHRRSLELYLESIISNVTFKATMCDSLNNFESDMCSNNTLVPMGEPWLASGAPRGTFFIKTNVVSPYALTEN